MSTELFSMAPSSLTEARDLCDIIAKSDFVPSVYKGKPGNVLVAMQLGARLGLAPMQAIQQIIPINGVPCLWGKGLLGVVQSHKDFLDMHTEVTDKQASCTIHRKGREPVTKIFTMEDAAKANLLNKDNWKKYPKDMMTWRAISRCANLIFPDALMGIEIKEIVQDYNIKTVNPEGSNVDKLTHILDGDESESSNSPPFLEDSVIASTEGVNNLQSLIVKSNTLDSTVNKWLVAAKVDFIDDLPAEVIDKLILHLETKLSEEVQA